MMNKTQKKCFLASASMHLLLFLVLLVGPAFLVSKNTVIDMPPIDFIPATLIDEAFQGGGQPAIQEPPPKKEEPRQVVRQPVTEPPPKEMKPEPKPVKEPEPAPKKLKYTKSDDIKVDLTKKRQPQQRPSPSDEKTRRRIAQDLEKDLSSRPPVPTSSVGLSSGPAYANYAQALKSIYDRAWQPPEGAASDEAIVRVEVKVARDGRVVWSKIISRSGDSNVDHSIQMTLDRVNYIAPFPAKTKDKDRTFKIAFNLKARRS